MADTRNQSIDETPISPSRPDHVRQNSLEKHLQHRPDPQELKDRHILLDTNAAPSLQSKALELERQLATDSLKKGLEHRSTKEDLIERMSLSSFPPPGYSMLEKMPTVLPSSSSNVKRS